MGTGINVQCVQCRYNGSFMLGTGAYYVLIENCLEAMPTKRVNEVNPLLQKYTMKNFEFAYKLFQCDDCLFLFDHSTLEVIFDNQMIYANRIECPACKKDLTDHHTSVEQIHELTALH